MTCRTHTKKAAVFHTAYIVFLSVCGLLSAYSAAYALHYISCTEDVIAVCFTIFFALVILAVDFFECRALGVRLYMTEDGIGIRRFGKSKVFIRWDSIREIGTGHIPTPFGSKERVYFCGRKLTERERSDLITMKHSTVHFSYIPKNWYSKMRERLPIPMPEEIVKKYVK